MCNMTKSHFSFRLRSDERELLADQAGLREISESELARRYVTEGIRRDRHPLITFVPWRPGRAVLASRPRLEVADVVETWKLGGDDRGAFAKPAAADGEPRSEGLEPGIRVV